MKCTACKRSGLPDDSVFCCYCGQRLKRDKEDITVPPPMVNAKGEYWNRIMVNGVRIPIKETTERKYYNKAIAYKTGAIETPESYSRESTGRIIDKYLNDNSNVFSPSTMRGYKGIRKQRFQSVMDTDIRKVNWQAVINAESAEVKPKTVRNAWRLVTAAMKYSKIPVPDVNLPQVPKKEKTFLDYKQIQILLQSIKGKDIETAIILGLHGLRRSEMLAITDKDITETTITVHGAKVLDENNNLVAKATNKNSTSDRVVPILIDRIHDSTKDKTGQLVNYSTNSLYRAINKACRDAGLPQVGVHGLRHSFISLCYHFGWSELHTERAGGYSNNQTVHDVYTHLSQHDINDDVKRIREFYN